MANGFLENSFKLGTPARGGGDLLSAFLGINTNPDVQLKGQVAGAKLGNLDARTRRANILGNQEQINLEDMQTLRRFITPEGEGSGGLNPQFQAMVQGSDYAGGQRGLATRTDRLNKEDSLATLAESGFTMPITGADGQTHNMLLSDAIKMMSGADFKAFVTANPEVRNLLSKANTRDAESLLRQTLLGKQAETEGQRKSLVEEQVEGEGYASEWKKTRRDMAKHSLAYAKKTENLKLMKARGELTKLSNQINKLALEINLKENEIALLPQKNIDALVGTLQALKNLEDDEFDRAAYIKLYSKLYIDNVQKMTRRGKAPPADKVAKATEMAILSAFASADKQTPNLDPDNPNNTIENLLKIMAPKLKQALAQILPELAQSGFNIPEAQEIDRAKDAKVDLLAQADALQGQLQPGDVAPPVQPQDGGPAALDAQGEGQALLSSLGVPPPGGRIEQALAAQNQNQSLITGQPPAHQDTVEQFTGPTREPPTGQPQPPLKKPVTLDTIDLKLEKKVVSPELELVYDGGKGVDKMTMEAERLLDQYFDTKNPKDLAKAKIILKFLAQKRQSQPLG